MGIINILGKVFNGNNVVINNGKVIIDGKEVSDHGANASINVIVTGDLNSLDCNTCTINGNVKGDVDANTVSCHDVGGNIDANTVRCGNVTGNIDANTVNKK